ncbi:hypothetical protein [Celeribacter baekdonensis]|uniref:hypothetical protein n=1 Tax=Celeribacter baekdonensis TaxID=875171 RepID=UPI003A95DB69
MIVVERGLLAVAAQSPLCPLQGDIAREGEKPNEKKMYRDQTRSQFDESSRIAFGRAIIFGHAIIECRAPDHPKEEEEGAKGMSKIGTEGLELYDEAFFRVTAHKSVAVNHPKQTKTERGPIERSVLDLSDFGLRQVSQSVVYIDQRQVV